MANNIEAGNKNSAYLLLFGLAFVWGSSFILIKISLNVFSPLETGLLRIGTGALVLSPIAFWAIKQVERNKLWRFWVCGMAGSVMPAVLFSWAGAHLNSGVSGSLNALTPMFTLILSSFVYKQRLQLFHYTGVFLGLIGAILLASSGTGIEALLNINAWALAVLAATICYAINIHLIKFWLAEYEPKVISSLTVSMAGFPGIVVLLVATPFLSRFQENHPFEFNFFSLVPTDGFYTSFIAALLLGTFGTAISLIYFNKLIKQTSAVFASSVTYLIPVFAMFWAVVQGENLGPQHYLGFTFVLGGIIILNRKR